MNCHHVISIVCCLVLAGTNCGCGNSRERYVPTATTARQAVQKSLDAWKSGTAHGPITSSKPTINVFDSRWRDGWKLESYEIIEDVKNAEQPQFKVRQKLQGVAEETTVYLVIGIDPLNVFREEDYKQAQSM